MEDLPSYPGCGEFVWDRHTTKDNLTRDELRASIERADEQM